MTQLDLREKYEMVTHNLLVYSDNYAMSKPKEGFMKEFYQMKEQALALEIVAALYNITL